MTLDKREKNMLYVLAVVLLAFVVDLFINSEDYAWLTGSSGGGEAHTEKVKPQVVKKASGVKAPYAGSIREWGRDPFFDPANTVKKKVRRKVKKVVALNLKAISIARSGSVAMINDKVLTVGDNISGYTITHIGEKSVELVRDGKSRIIKLK